MLPRGTITVCVLFTMFFGASIASATKYALIDLGPAGSDTTCGGYDVAMVGSAPEVVGASGNVNTLIPFGGASPVVWSNGTPSVLSIPGIGTTGSALRIDTNGDIVGRGISTADGGASRAFYVPHGGTGMFLPVLSTGGEDLAAAWGVNDAGQVVGESSSTDAGNNYHAFIWSANGGIVDLGGFAGALATEGTISKAMAINASGQVVGMSYTSSGGYDPAMWVYSTTTAAWSITDLNPTHSVVHGDATAFAVNAAGDAVGIGYLQGSINFAEDAVLFKHDGTVVDLGNLGNSLPNGSARGINDSGVIVGYDRYAGGGTGAYHAFVYANSTTGMQDLNSAGLVLNRDAWMLDYASGIDSAGDITGYGTNGAGQVHGYLLMPAISGDANLDGRVDINDLTIVLAHYGQTGTTWGQGEFTGDGTVDINDLTIVLANYGNTDSVGASAPGIAAAPEPASLVLLGIGAISLLTYAWRWKQGA